MFIFDTTVVGGCEFKVFDVDKMCIKIPHVEPTLGRFDINFLTRFVCDALQTTVRGHFKIRC